MFQKLLHSLYTSASLMRTFTNSSDPEEMPHYLAASHLHNIRF